MPIPSRRFVVGKVDILSLLGVVFLVISVGAITITTANINVVQVFSSFAASFARNRCIDKASCVAQLQKAKKEAPGAVYQDPVSGATYNIVPGTTNQYTDSAGNKYTLNSDTGQLNAVANPGASTTNGPTDQDFLGIANGTITSGNDQFNKILNLCQSAKAWGGNGIDCSGGTDYYNLKQFALQELQGNPTLYQQGQAAVNQSVANKVSQEAAQGQINTSHTGEETAQNISNQMRDCSASGGIWSNNTCQSGPLSSAAGQVGSIVSPVQNAINQVSTLLNIPTPTPQSSGGYRIITAPGETDCNAKGGKFDLLSGTCIITPTNYVVITSQPQITISQESISQLTSQAGSNNANSLLDTFAKGCYANGGKLYFDSNHPRQEQCAVTQDTLNKIAQAQNSCRGGILYWDSNSNRCKDVIGNYIDQNGNPTDQYGKPITNQEFLQANQTLQLGSNLVGTLTFGQLAPGLATIEQLNEKHNRNLFSVGPSYGNTNEDLQAAIAQFRIGTPLLIPAIGPEIIGGGALAEGGEATTQTTTLLSKVQGVANPILKSIAYLNAASSTQQATEACQAEGLKSGDCQLKIGFTALAWTNLGSAAGAGEQLLGPVRGKIANLALSGINLGTGGVETYQTCLGQNKNGYYCGLNVAMNVLMLGMTGYQGYDLVNTLKTPTVAPTQASLNGGNADQFSLAIDSQVNTVKAENLPPIGDEQSFLTRELNDKLVSEPTAEKVAATSPTSRTPTIAEVKIGSDLNQLTPAQQLEPKSVIADSNPLQPISEIDNLNAELADTADPLFTKAPPTTNVSSNADPLVAFADATGIENDLALTESAPTSEEVSLNKSFSRSSSAGKLTVQGYNAADPNVDSIEIDPNNNKLAYYVNENNVLQRFAVSEGETFSVNNEKYSITIDSSGDPHLNRLTGNIPGNPVQTAVTGIEKAASTTFTEKLGGNINDQLASADHANRIFPDTENPIPAKIGSETITPDIPNPSLDSQTTTSTTNIDPAVEADLNDSNLPQNRIAKEVTGLEPKDPGLADKLLSDHLAFKEKYGLPSRELRFSNPEEYLNQLTRVAKDHGISINYVDSTTDPVFSKNPLAGAYYDEVTNSINFRNNTDPAYIAYQLPSLEHELVHGLQFELEPNMPIEQREYEAYLTSNFSISPKNIGNPEMRLALFDEVSMSVNHWYVNDQNIPNPWMPSPTTLAVDTVTKTIEVGATKAVDSFENTIIQPINDLLSGKPGAASTSVEAPAPAPISQNGTDLGTIEKPPAPPADIPAPVDNTPVDKNLILATEAQKEAAQAQVKEIIEDPAFQRLQQTAAASKQAAAEGVHLLSEADKQQAFVRAEYTGQISDEMLADQRAFGKAARDARTNDLPTPKFVYNKLSKVVLSIPNEEFSFKYSDVESFIQKYNYAGNDINDLRNFVEAQGGSVTRHELINFVVDNEMVHGASVVPPTADQLATAPTITPPDPLTTDSLSSQADNLINDLVKSDNNRNLSTIVQPNPVQTIFKGVVGGAREAIAGTVEGVKNFASEAGGAINDGIITPIKEKFGIGTQTTKLPATTIEEVPVTSPETENSNSSFRYQADSKAFDPLVKKITGLGINDPTLPERLILDRDIIRAKYDLPPIEMRRQNPGEYINRLKEIASSLGYEVRDLREIPKFTEEYSQAGALHTTGSSFKVTGVPTIFYNPESSQVWDLEHELIHAFQAVRSPSMPIEAMEYEAYLGSYGSPEKLSNDNLREFFFDQIYGSSSFWYKSNDLTNPWNEAPINEPQPVKLSEADLSAKPNLFQQAVSFFTKRGTLSIFSGGAAATIISKNFDSIKNGVINAWQSLLFNKNTSLPSSQPVENTAGTGQLPSNVNTSPKTVSAVPYKGFINTKNIPSGSSYYVYVKFANVFNEVFAENGFPTTQSEKNAFIAQVISLLNKGDESNPQMQVLLNSKTFQVYLEQRIGQSNLFNYTPYSNEELIQCNLWAIGVADIYHTLNPNSQPIVADQYNFSNGGAFGLSENYNSRWNKNECGGGMSAALSNPSCSGQNLAFQVQGDIVAYRVIDYSQINAGDSYVYNQHFGVILNKYYLNGKYWFLVSEANSPKAAIDNGTPATYLVSQDDFASKINPLAQTYFLELGGDPAKAKATTDPSQPDSGVLATINSYNNPIAANPIPNPVQNSQTSQVSLNSNVTSVNSSTNPDFSIYYSQVDPKWQKQIPTSGTKVANSSCSIFAIANMTGINPVTVWDNMASTEHIAYLTADGLNTDTVVGQMQNTYNYTPRPISGKVNDIKNQIAQYTSQGIPVLISGDMYIKGAGWIPHHDVAVGVQTSVDSSGNITYGDIIFNDSAYINGKGIAIPDDHIDESHWRITAFIPNVAQTNP